MSRIVTVAAAQLGPIARDEPRASVVGRPEGLIAGANEIDARGKHVLPGGVNGYCLPAVFRSPQLT